MPEHEGDYKLPSGKTIYIGTGYFERYDGEYFEWNGVPPDLRIVQTGEEAAAGVDKQLEYAIKWILQETGEP
jgi:C-terminal processing protease CtpA/Prc